MLEDHFWKNFLVGAPASQVAIWIEQIIQCAYELRLEPGDVAIDCGAHRARHTIPMAAAVGTRGKVFAVEAAPEMQQKLRANINRAEVPSIRSIVEYVDYAMSNVSGESEFFYFPEIGSGLSSLQKRDSIPEGSYFVQQTVVTRTMDAVIGTEHPVKFIKADIEGAEFHAFQGGRTLISRHRPMIVFENSAVSDAERFNYTMEDFFSFWEGLEYSLYTVFGKRHDRANWGKRHAHDLFAIPNERNAEDLAIIHLAILGASSQLICAKP